MFFHFWAMKQWVMKLHLGVMMPTCHQHFHTIPSHHHANTITTFPGVTRGPPEGQHQHHQHHSPAHTTLQGTRGECQPQGTAGWCTHPAQGEVIAILWLYTATLHNAVLSHLFFFFPPRSYILPCSVPWLLSICIHNSSSRRSVFNSPCLSTPSQHIQSLACMFFLS